MSATLATWVGLLALGLLPLLLMVSTSFAKASVVLSLLRNALGTGAVPSGAIVFALAALLSVYVMAPVAQDAVRAASGPASRVSLDAPFEAASRGALLEALRLSAARLAAFLERNAGVRERELFVELAAGARPAGRRDEVDARGLLVLLPAFLITELKEALQMGFLLLLPFLVVDFVVASVLASLGMTGLQPSTVALPLKLLLFVSVDGFYVLSRALVASYG